MWLDLASPWQAFLSVISLKCLLPVLLDLAFSNLEIQSSTKLRRASCRAASFGSRRGKPAHSRSLLRVDGM